MVESAQLRDDLTLEEATDGGVSGSLYPYKGYNRVAFTETTRLAVEQTYGQLIDTTLRDYAKVQAKRERNIRAHDGKPEKGEAMVIPIAKRDTNQQLAWLLMTLFKDPLITVTPLESGHIEIVSKDESGNAEVTTITTEEESRAIQDLVNFFLRDKIHFKRTVRAWLAEMLRDGNRPPILKIISESRETTVAGHGYELGNDVDRAGKKVSPILRVLDGPMYRKVRDGEPVRIECVPGERFYVPFPSYDIQAAPFVFQEFEEDTVSIKQKIASGEYNFCLDQEEKSDQEAIDLVLSGADNMESLKKDRGDGRVPSDPQKTHRLFELWHFFPFAEKVDGETTFTMLSLCSVVHWPSRKWLTCYENPNWHGKRPFHAGYMQQRPFSFSGYSTTENVAPFQRLISQLFHLQVQNMVTANVKVIFARRTSSTFKFLNGKKLRPGLIIPFDEPDDVSPHPLGVPIESMSAEISFLNSESEKMSVVTQYDRGNIPNRTPAATVAAVENLAKMQPAMVLDNVRETIADCVKMYVQSLIQYAQTGGITIPFQKPVTREVILKTIYLPREVIVDQFGFEVTATAEDETPEALFTKYMQGTQQVSAFNNEAMMVTSGSWKPGVPPPLVDFGTKLLVGKRNMVAKLLSSMKLNPDEFLPTEQEIKGVPLQLMQMQMQMQAMGGMNGAAELPSSGPGAGLPSPGGDQDGPSLMGGQPDVESGLGGNPPLAPQGGAGGPQG